MELETDYLSFLTKPHARRASRMKSSHTLGFVSSKSNWMAQGMDNIFESLQNLCAISRRRASQAGRYLLSGPAAVEVLEPRQMLAADMVVRWNSVMLDAIRAVAPPPPVASRAMAIESLAVFDALNSIEGKYAPYLTKVVTSLSTSKEAAVAQAAYRTLVALFPTYQPTLDAELATSMSMVADGAAKTAGINLGNTVATAILNLRATDGSSAVVAYTPGTAPGAWRPTPPALAAALLPQWPRVKTFGLTSGAQYRPVAPPALSSAAYATDYNQVKSLGSATSTTRTAEQADIARFWAGGGGTATPPGQWNMIAQAVSESKCLSIEENARMFAMLNMALADAAISAWDAKYAFNFWRPITAIQNGNVDSNSATIQDIAWTPLLTTPPFQGYVSGHSTFSGAGAAVLGAFFGTDQVSFVLKSEAAGVADRGFSGFKQAAAEAGISRIYGGIHFNFDNVEGLKLGEKIGLLIAGKFLTIKPTVSLTNGVLTVTGSNANDTIRLDQYSGAVYVTVNNQLLLRTINKSVTKIVVDAGDGDDTVAVNSTFTTETLINGGRGNDHLSGGSGKDVIYGGDGNDRLYGNGGADQLYGGEGDDTLDGGALGDTLSGGNGIDTLFVTRGLDLWETGPGRKIIVYR